jgi:tetratricopeptide (TPR) repeat protein
MICLHKKVWISLSILLLLSLPSCGGGKRIQLKSTLSEAQQDLMSGDFQKALDAYQFAFQKHREDGEILNRYIGAIESIKTSGDGAFDRKDFAQAQIIYDLLLKNFPRFSEFASLLSFERNLLVTRLRLSRMLGVEKQGQSCLKRGEIQKAIDIYRDLHLQYPWDPIVRDRYIRILESIKGRADAAFRNDDLALAGWTYKLLLKNYPSHLARLLSYNNELLDAKIESCRKILFENGLEQYRFGNLPQAISVWRSILTFDPENPEVKKAVDTAILQSRNLKRNKAYNAK